MATAVLSNFKGALIHGGARPSLFDIIVTAPTFSPATSFTNMATHCNVSSIPPLTLTPIERQYFGRTVKIPGDMVFGDLSTTIINTENYSIKKDIEAWMDKINSTSTNKGFSDSASGYGTVKLTQYSKAGKSLLTWTFVDCWPQTVAELPLSYDTASDIEQFDVTWAYNYYTQAKGELSTAATRAKQD